MHYSHVDITTSIFSREDCQHVAIGDLHGRICWQADVEFLLSRYKKIIFVGDYVDSFVYSDEQIMENLLALIELKKKYPDQVVLLLGNHDVHYWLYPKFQGKGFRHSQLSALKIINEENRHLFQVAYQHKNTLLTHAGISQTWVNWARMAFDVDVEQMLEDYGNLAELLNELGKINRYYDLVFSVGGKSSAAGPCWIRPSQHLHRPLLGYHQIVGHTPSTLITTHLIDKDTSLTVVDCLGSIKTYYEF